MALYQMSTSLFTHSSILYFFLHQLFWVVKTFKIIFSFVCASMFLFSVKITLKLQLFPIVYHLLKTKIGSKNPPNLFCAHVIYVYYKMFKDFRKYMTIKNKYELKGSCMLTKTSIRTVLQRKMCQTWNTWCKTENTKLMQVYEIRHVFFLFLF